jgi:hypothetical protein
MQSLQGFAQQQFESNKVCHKLQADVMKRLRKNVFDDISLESTPIHIC